MMEVLDNTLMAIILQYVSVSNQHIIHLHNVRSRLYLNKAGEKKKQRRIKTRLRKVYKYKQECQSKYERENKN